MTVVCSWKIFENCLRKIMENSSFMRFDRSKITFNRWSETVTNLFGSIDIQLLVDWLNFLFRLIEERSSTDQARQIVEFGSIDIQLLVDRSNVLFWLIEKRLSTDRARQIVKYEFFNFFDRLRYTFDRLKLENLESFLSVFTYKENGYVWLDYTCFLIKKPLF